MALGRCTSGTPMIEIQQQQLDLDRTIFIDKDLIEEYDKIRAAYFSLIKRDPHLFINLVITSEGGPSTSWTSFGRFIRAFTSTPLRTICTVKAYSAGSLIFMFGKERWMANDSALFLHNGNKRVESTWGAKTFRDLADELEFSDHCYRMTFLDAPGIDPQKMNYAVLKKLMDEESTITAQQALELTLATRII